MSLVSAAWWSCLCAHVHLALVRVFLRALVAILCVAPVGAVCAIMWAAVHLSFHHQTPRGLRGLQGLSVSWLVCSIVSSRCQRALLRSSVAVGSWLRVS